MNLSSMPLNMFLLTIALSLGVVGAAGDGFLVAQPKGSTTEEEFRAAMSTVMGCGGGVKSERLAAVEKALLPMWRVLPKTRDDLVEWRMVRYVAHRYFMQQWSLLVRGFEPMRQINSSHLGSAEILTQKVPSLVETVLESKRSSNGFSLQETVAMVATLQQLISDAEHTLLEKVYQRQRKSTRQTLSHIEISDIIEAYMVHWMMDGDEATIKLLLKDRSLLGQVLPKWPEVKGFVDGIVKTMEFSRQHSPKPGHGMAAWGGQYTFEDAHEAVGAITKQFASFWETECQTIKQSLVALDKTGTGRISLPDFYGANSDGEWRFGESEAYLRELGALDESSVWRGKQVIIPNYLQGASNCIVMNSHYLVCCINECETVLNDVEDAIGAPVADPEQILPLVGNMSNLEDEQPKLDEALKSQLFRIAETHGGKVPLHGRLFAQWLHYVFPRECPFPHKSGTTSFVTPGQFGDDFMVTSKDIENHAAARNESSEKLATAEEVKWMSQWSEEEELIGDYSLQLRAPWESKRQLLIGGIAVIALLAIIGGAASGKTGKQAASVPHQKSHFV